MTMIPWRAVFALGAVVAIAAALLLSGCSARVRVASVPPPASGAIVSGQKGKDAVILSEAAQIDAIAPDAKPHTDAQRAAVAAAPAVDVEKLDADWKKVVANREEIIAKLTKERDDARNATDKAIRIGAYSISAILVALGVASFFLAAQVPFLGPKISMALIAAGLSVFSMIQAYEWTKAHPWITGIALLFLAVAGALAYANNHHAKNP